MNIGSIGIIGFGDFGQFIAALAKEHFPGVQVKISSSRNPADGTRFFSFEETCTTDLLFLCVPISAFEATVQKIQPFLGEQTIVVDVTTVKKHTTTVLRENNIPRFIATHPMFGPYSYAKHGNSLKDLRIALCDSTLSPDELSEVITFLKDAELKILELGPDEHDKLVAETLFLTHLVGQTIHKGKFERTSIDTVSFGFLMDAVESVMHDDALFQEVYKYNPYCKEVLERYEGAEKEVISSLR